MKKYPEKETSVQQPNVKKVLRQTYIASLLCLAMCVSMFLGTSYAWFTSEIDNVGNEIYVGTLKVGLYKDDASLADSQEKLFDSNIRWEPGYTALETIRVVNEGDLAFKYEMTFTDGKLPEGDTAKLDDVAKYFEVWSYYHKDDAAPTVNDYMDITKQDGWTKVGTLDEVLANSTTVLQNVMESVRYQNLAADSTEPTNAGTTDGKPTSHTYTIALHMNENATPDVMGKKITLNVKLVAYQVVANQDEVANNVKVDHVGTLGNLATALMKDSQNTCLDESVTIDAIDKRVTMNGGVFNGNGKTLTYTGGRDTNNNSSVGVLTTTGGVIKNLTIDGKKETDGTMNGRALYITNLTSNLTVSNCTLDGAYSFNLNSAKKTQYTLNFVGTTFKSWTSYANVVVYADFAGCRFENILKPYGDTTLNNCIFVKTGDNVGLDVSALEVGETIKLVNCTYMGVSDVNLVVTNVNGTVTLEGEESRFEISTNKLLVLKASTTK